MAQIIYNKSNSKLMMFQTRLMQHKSHIVNPNELTKHLYAYAMVPTNAGKNIRILDSGCTRHMFPQRGYFIPGTYKPYKQPQAVEFGDESKAEVLGYGDVRLISKVNGGLIEITLTDCLYVPTFPVSEDFGF